MPAALVADNINFLHNFRALGRLSIPLGIFLTFYIIIQLSNILFVNQEKKTWKILSKKINLPLIYIFILCSIQLLEVYPLMKPVKSMSLNPIENSFTKEDILYLSKLNNKYTVMMIAPAVNAQKKDWVQKAFAIGYYSKMKTNLFYLARYDKNVRKNIEFDLDLIMTGKWKDIESLYKVRMVFVLPSSLSFKNKAMILNNYKEKRISSMSVWEPLMFKKNAK